MTKVITFVNQKGGMGKGSRPAISVPGLRDRVRRYC